MGLLAIVDGEPFEEVESKKSLLETFRARAAQELERRKAEEELLYVSEEIDLFSSSLKQLHRLKSTNHDRFEDMYGDYLRTGCDLFGLPIGLLLAFVLGYGPAGLWWGLVAGLGAVAVCLLLRVRLMLRRNIARVKVD